MFYLYFFFACLSYSYFLSPVMFRLLDQSFLTEFWTRDKMLLMAGATIWWTWCFYSCPVRSSQETGTSRPFQPSAQPKWGRTLSRSLKICFLSTTCWVTWPSTICPLDPSSVQGPVNSQVLWLTWGFLFFVFFLNAFWGFPYRRNWRRNSFSDYIFLGQCKLVAY